MVCSRLGSRASCSFVGQAFLPAEWLGELTGESESTLALQYREADRSLRRSEIAVTERFVAMENFICVQCGTQFGRTAEPPARCVICEDERQFVRQQGQQWTTLEQ